MFDVYDNELIKFTVVSFNLAKMSLLEYSCVKSKHAYTQHHIPAVIMLNEEFKNDLLSFHFDYTIDA
jgi:hypothetical protein